MIKKWPIVPGDTVSLPDEQDVIFVAMQGAGYFYWTRDIDLQMAEARGQRLITLVATGDEAPAGSFHLGSIVDDGRGLVWHLFQSGV